MSKYTTAVLLIVTEARSSTNYKILSKVFVEMSSSLSGKLNKSYYIQIQPIDVWAFLVNLLFSTCGDFEMKEHQSQSLFRYLVKSLCFYHEAIFLPLLLIFLLIINSIHIF
jgi:hypothetical protein